MITTADDAMLTLYQASQGVYQQRFYATTTRDFKLNPMLIPQKKEFKLDPLLASPATKITGVAGGI